MKKSDLFWILVGGCVANVLYFFVVPLMSDDGGIEKLVVPVVDDHMPHSAEKPYRK